MKNKDFLFDIDGTLTPPLKCMMQSHTHFFLSWSIDKNFYLVSGSDIQKIKKQLPHSILRRSKGIFSSMANVLEDWRGRVVYKNDWKCSTKLLNELQVILNESPYPHDRRGVRRGLLRLLEHGLGTCALHPRHGGDPAVIGVRVAVSEPGTVRTKRSAGLVLRQGLSYCACR